MSWPIYATLTATSLTLGQYLQPATDRYLPVVRYVTPDEFDTLGQQAQMLGFHKVASGPFVRSSYHARDMAETDIDLKNDVPNEPVGNGTAF